MSRLTANFFRWEYACKDGCGYNTVDYELATKVQDIRDAAGCKIMVNSGCRCLTHNTAVGGSVNSYHIYAKAADIVAELLDSTALWNLIDNMFPLRYGLIRYRNFVHFDVRPGLYRSFDWS